MYVCTVLVCPSCDVFGPNRIREWGDGRFMKVDGLVERGEEQTKENKSDTHTVCETKAGLEKEATTPAEAAKVVIARVNFIFFFIGCYNTDKRRESTTANCLKPSK